MYHTYVWNRGVFVVMPIKASSDEFLASQLPVQCLASRVNALDQFLDGGLRCGELSEWGVPLGRGGRDVILRYLAQRRSNTPSFWSLWICGSTQVKIYPPAWLARGVDLGKIRFTYSSHPVRDLKPVFLDPFFRVIVIDSPRSLSLEDCAFLAQRARRHRQAILLLRDYFLSPKRGNVWAKLRINCWQDERDERIRLRVVRGLSPRELALDRGTLEV
jgi:hypothetical protein